MAKSNIVSTAIIEPLTQAVSPLVANRKVSKMKNNINLILATIFAIIALCASLMAIIANILSAIKSAG